MKLIKVILLLSICFNSIAQFKVPSKESIKKEVKSLKKDAENLNLSSKSEIPDAETKSPAKSQINSFWKQIEKMQNHQNPQNKQVVYSNGIQSAQMNLKNTKSKDPNYDTAEMEKALKECQDQYSSIASSKQNLRDTRSKTLEDSERLLKNPYVFTKAELNIGGDKTNDRVFIDSKLKESHSIIDDYTNQIGEFLKSNPEKIIYQNDKSIVNNHVKYSETVINKADDIYKNYRSLAAVSGFQNLLIYKAYIESMMKVFPEESTYENYLSKINLAIKKYGTAENYMNKMEANQKEYIKNLRMAKAVINDPVMEKIAKQEYEKANMSSQKYTVFKVNLVSNWKLEKNELGIPLHKELYVNMAIKLADGKCGLAIGWLHQEYTGGGSYSSAMLYNASGIQELPCENLK